MVFDASHIALLIYQSLTGDNTSEQQAELENWLDEAPQHWAFFDQMTQEEVFAYDLKAQSPARISVLRNELHRMIQRKTGMRIPLYPVADSNPIIQRMHFLKTAWFRYVAMLLLIAGTAIYVYNIHGRQKETVQQADALQQPDIGPGGNKAMLTLADGSTIVLDSAANGNLAIQGNTQILKLDGGALAYHADKQTAVPGEVLYNTINTPKGGQYQIELSDGSIVWLNAASSITFPIAFAKDRKISITGEAYLEVAADKNKPFLVKTGQTTIQVLGTSFNVNAYPEEDHVSTTLVTGSVRVNAYNQLQTLLPGQQLQVNHTGSLTLVKNIDVGSEIAWKNGVFHFNRARIAAVMVELARWYDVEIVYDKNIPDVSIIGEMKRNLTLHQILELLKEMGVKCQLDGRRIIVYE